MSGGLSGGRANPQHLTTPVDSGLGWYPSGSESDAAVTAMRDFVVYLADRIVACADRYPISALVLCDSYRISDQATRKQVLSLSERHDEFVCEYIDALAEEHR